jgi:ribulose-bisphosphate carboxylase large chain
MKPVWHTASGGLHAGSIADSIKQLGEDIVIQCGGGVLGHPWGIEAGVEAVVQARDLALERKDINEWKDRILILISKSSSGMGFWS